ncbi:MAG: amino acid permease [Holosporales bacterium]|nr:amino acid permease [Holosporales bacterium]
MSRHKELGFVALVSIVIGGQLGSGAFVLPAQLAPLKTIGMLGWIVSVASAISLALVFSDLSSHLPKNGGPHVYVSAAFGRVAAFFTAWIYWIISWSSNSVLLVTIAGYLTTITGQLTTFEIFTVEILTLFLITYINIVGMEFSGIIETVLTALKILPLLVLPVVFFMFFDPEFFNFSVSEHIKNTNESVLSTIATTSLLTFWGFIGVESATTPAENVKNPKKNIPRALIIGTSCVALIYIINTISITGVVGFDKLLNSTAPYAVVMGSIFDNYSHVTISLMAIIVCVGTLNAWTLTGGQIAYGAYKDGLFPKIFGKVNKSGAPTTALLIAAVGIIPFLVLEQFETGRLDRLIGILASVFLYVYLICCISYLKLINKWYKTKREKLKARILAHFSIISCIFVLSQSIVSSIIVLVIFILVGIPIFLKYKNVIKAISV